MADPRPGRPLWADADGCPHAGSRSRHMRAAKSDRLSYWVLYIWQRNIPGFCGLLLLELEVCDFSGVMRAKGPWMIV